MISLPQIDNVLNNLQTAINKKNNCSVFGLSLGEKAFFLSKQNRQVVLVTNSVADGIKYAEMFESFGKKCKTLFFNGGDYFSLHSATISDNLISSVDALNSLAAGKVDCLIMSPICLMQKYTPKDTFKKSVINIKKGQTINQKKLIQNLINIGYRRTEQISAPGEFMIRGDTFDIFSMLSTEPVRVEFFDDEVDTISYFNIETYRKTKDITKAEIVPTSQFVFDCDTNSQIFDNISNSFEKTIKTLEPNQQVLLNTNYEEFKINFDGKNYFQIKNWLIPFFKYDSIVSYFDSDALLVFDDVKLVYDTIKNEYKQFEDAYKNIQNSGDVLLDQKNYYLSENDIFNFDKQLLSFQQITTSNRIFNPTFVASFKSSAQTNYFGNYDLLVEDLKYYLEFNNTVIVCAGSKEHAKYLSKFLQSKSIDICEDCENGICDNKVNVVSSNIPYGAIFVEDNLVLIGTKELLKKSTKQKVQTSQNKKEEFTLPKIGDLVVHETYGIGKCVGIEKLKFSDFEKDYVILQYDGADKLYLPTEQLGLISGYVSTGKEPKLNKLGTKDFEKTKAKVKSSLKELAFNLVELYSKREHIKGYKFEVDRKLYEEFENSFPYEETADQLAAIKEIYDDMTQGRVMDRIVCGDVGYGKTEVALRAAFIAALNSKQVCFLAPTTILSEQHFNTAKSRLQQFGIVVECLNRFKTKAEQKQIVEKLKNGEIDVICGTHRLLSQDIKFKDLGLLILDEEQRFGVGDKEKIKTLKTNVDVLTLSATPIPRTLHMGLVGIRDISLISTAPSERLPVQTTVVEYSDNLIMQAINRELARNGQVLVVYNRVETIVQFTNHIKSLFGEDIKISYAHGQMDSEKLENEIMKLYKGETQILVSTTLIENGIDLPNANTLIVIDADNLGLSQLYQLKGRVGRSKNLGYAYFTFRKDKMLSGDAYKRLNAIMEFTELGSGFKIAMKDLEIRGCGNILGPEQSGHMAKVGYDLYCKILSQAISEIKGKKQKEYKEIKLDVALDCYIPEDYIHSSEERFDVYNSLKQINSTETKEKVIKEISDIYGKIPDNIQHLAFVALLRNTAREFDIKRISIDRQRCLAEFYSKEQMLDKSIAGVLKEENIKTYFSQSANIMNFALDEYSVKKKLEILCDIFEKALKSNKEKN